VSATADEKLEAANWNLEQLLDGRGPEAVEQLLKRRQDRVASAGILLVPTLAACRLEGAGPGEHQPAA